MTSGELRVRGDDPELLLPPERTLPLHVPAVVELTLVAVGPLLRYVMRSMRRARREIHKERLLRHQSLLLTHPRDRPISQILRQVITSSGVPGGSTGVVPSYSAGSHWLFSPPMKP